MRRTLNTLALVGAALCLTPSTAGAGSCPVTIDEIADIQSNTDAGGGSLCVGANPVALDGIVYAVFPDGDGFAYADAAGAWNGIFVYLGDPSAFPVPEVGDEVLVSGFVSEFNGLTEISFPSGSCSGVGATCDLAVASSGNVPYGPTVVATGDLATGDPNAESWEGVYVEVQGVTVSNENPDDPSNFGEFEVDDGSGAVRVDDVGDYAFEPFLGTALARIRGMHHFSFGNHKIEPTGECDIWRTGGDISGSPTLLDIADVQGTGFTSPVVGQLVTVSGLVTGEFEGNYTGFGNDFDAFFLQDPVGDGNPATSDGVLVMAPPSAVTVAAEYDVTGVVGEFSEFDGLGCTDDCMTVLCPVVIAEVVPAPPDEPQGAAPVTWAPPTDTDDLYEYHESLEGMLVAVDGDATVVGPTSFGTIFVVDADEGVDRVLRGSTQHGRQVGARFSTRRGGNPDDLIVSSVVSNVDGPLVTTYGDPVVVTQPADGWTTVTSAPIPSPEPTWVAADGNTFSIMSLNAENFDDGDSDKLGKMTDIVTAAGCPTFVALQEVDTVSTLAGDEDEVLTEVKASLLGEGCAYDSASSHPDIGDHGVAILWRTDQVSGASWHADLQGCSADGSSSAAAYDDFCDLVPEYPLFSRRPVVLTATVGAACGDLPTIEVAIIANHFKSKLGGASADQRRLEQAQLVAQAASDLIGGGTEHVLVLGDLNDFEDSPPITALTLSGELTNLWAEVAAGTRYSFIFSGVSQVLDHLLASTALLPERVANGVLHYNADFPFDGFANNPAVPWGLTDHDHPVATFSACEGGFVFADGFESGDVSRWSAATP